MSELIPWSDFESEQKKNQEFSVEEIKNKGKLILDATCAPGDITYPNDLGILNQARRQTERIIDSLYKSCQTKLKQKPRTYKKKARKDYLKVAKKRRPSRKERTDAIAKQLQYVKKKNCIMAKLPETSETSIAITFLVINLSPLLRQVNCLFLSLFLHRYFLRLHHGVFN